MPPRPSRRQAIVETLADHILAAGLANASLRPLAAAAGTSDRMLLYYFADKNELISLVLACIAQRLTRLMDSAVPGTAPYPLLLPHIVAFVTSEPVRPHMRLWLELVALAARHEEPFRSIASQLADGFLAWAAQRLEVEREADRPAAAALLLATVEGFVLLDAIGKQSLLSTALATPRPKLPPRARPQK
jgi:AcrR family transcriptional regulator